MIIRFGKYAGRDIEELPCSYLRWLDENLDDAVNGLLLTEVRKEIRFRKREGLTVKNVEGGYLNA